MRREKLFSPPQVPDASWGEIDFAHAPLCPFYIESLLHLQNDAEQKVIRIILDTCHIQTAIRHKPAHLHAWKRPVPGEQKDKTPRAHLQRRLHANRASSSSNLGAPTLE